MTCALHLPMGGNPSLPCDVCGLVAYLENYLVDLKAMHGLGDTRVDIDWLETHQTRVPVVEVRVRIPRRGKMVRR